MEKFDILLWLIGGGFGLMLVMWNNIHHSIFSLESRLDKKIDESISKLDKKVDESVSRLDKKIDDVKNDLGKRIDDLGKRADDQLKTTHEMNAKIGEMDKRLYGIETVLHMKDCCVLKQDQNLKKAE